MLVADALSSFAPLKAPDIPLDITINYVYITPDRKTEFQTLIQDDLLLCSLAEIITAGWPDNINNVPHTLCWYHGHRDILIVEDGLILWDEALIIPPIEREKILQAIHEEHMGISKCQTRVRHCMYWPGINSDIKCLIESCPTCQHHCPQEQQEHYIHHQPQNTHGNSLALTTSTLTNLNTYLSQTTTPRWPSSEESLHLNAMPSRPSQSCRNSLQNMASQRYSVLTMAPSLPMYSSLSLQQTGSSTKPQLT